MTEIDYMFSIPFIEISKIHRLKFPLTSLVAGYKFELLDLRWNDVIFSVHCFYCCHLMQLIYLGVISD